MQKTRDTLFDGLLVCTQYKHGYRFSIDAVLLAHFCQPLPKAARILDLCCGSAVVGMILLYRNREILIDGLEIQSSLVRLAKDNITRNMMNDRYHVLHGDAAQFRDILKAESYDLVVCNPPYRKAGSGRLNSSDEATIARHEITAQLQDFIQAAAFAVKNRGRVCFVYPSARASFLIHSMEMNNMAVKTIQPVYSYPGASEAKIILVEAIKNGGEHCSISQPLYLYTQKNGNYTSAVERMYRT